MKRFYTKLLVFGIILFLPFILIVTRYVYLDPYCDFGIDKKYNLKFWFNSLGDLSTKKLLNNKKIKYNTFVFGSSRSTHFYTCYIKQKIFNNDRTIQPYYYGNFGETIGGIYKKMALLDSLNYKLDNIIILLDPDMAFELNGHPQKYDYKSYTERSTFSDFLYHFNSFFSNKNEDINYKFALLLSKSITDSLLYTKESDPISNDQGHICSYYKTFQNLEKIKTEMVNKNHIKLITNSVDYKSPKKTSISKIGSYEKIYLRKIKHLLKKHQSKYAVLISPLLSKETLSHIDYQILASIFGKNRLLDFSGENRITLNPTNFKDPKHFNNIISKQILDSLSSSSIFNQ